MENFELSVFANRIAAFCDKTVAVPCRAVFSPNIREGLHFSCAASNPKGDLCVQAARIPVVLSGRPPALCSPLRA